MTAPIDAEEVPLKAEDAAKADASNRVPENLARKAHDAESTRPQPEKQAVVVGQEGSKAEAMRQEEKAFEEQRQKQQKQQRT